VVDQPSFQISIYLLIPNKGHKYLYLYQMQLNCFYELLFLILLLYKKTMSMIPKNFEDWKWCIEKQCDIPLTVEFAKQRLVVYEDLSNAETQRFVSNYGIEHLENIKKWMRIVMNSVEKKIEFNLYQNEKKTTSHSSKWLFGGR